MAILPSRPIGPGAISMAPNVQSNPAPSGPGFIDKLRMGNTFNPASPTPDVGGYDPNMYGNSAAVTGQAPESQYPMMDRFTELLGDIPEDEGPGILKKIAASMMALNDPRLAMSMLQQPSAESVQWENQIGLAQKAAEMEGLQGQRQAGTATAERRLDISEDRLTFDIGKFMQELNPMEKQTLEIEKIEVRNAGDIAEIERRAELAQQRGNTGHAQALTQIAARGREARETGTTRLAGQMTLEDKRQEGKLELNALKKNNPNFQFRQIKDGKIVAFNPQNPSEVVYTGVHGSALTAEDAAELKIETDLAIAEGRAGISRESTRQSQERGASLAQGTAGFKEMLGGGRSDKPTSAGKLTNQQRTRQQANRASDYQRSNPKLAKFITVDAESGEVSIKPVGTGTEIFGGEELSKDEYEQIYDAIYRPDEITGAELVPDADTGPQIGDRKTANNGMELEFDGQGWAPVE